MLVPQVHSRDILIKVFSFLPSLEIYFKREEKGRLTTKVPVYKRLVEQVSIGRTDYPT